MRCCVFGCRSRTCRQLKDVNYYSFPKDPRIRNCWIKSTGRRNWLPGKYSRICSKHFNESCFRRTSQRVLLKPCSTPTLHIHRFPVTVAGKRSTRRKEIKSTNGISIKFDTINFTQSNGSIESIKMRPLLDSSKLQFHRELIERANIDSSHIIDEDELENMPTISNVLNTSNLKNNNESGMSAIEENTLVKSDCSKHVCRTCLQTVDALSLFNLFQAWAQVWEGMENTIAEDLAKLANIEVSESDNQSKYICNSCCIKLHIACTFVSQVKKNDKLFNIIHLKCEEDLIDKSWPKPIQIDKNLVCDNGMNVEIKQEVLSDEENNCNLEDGYREHNILDIKVEPEEIVEPAPIQNTVNGSSITEFTENSFHNTLEAIENRENNMLDLNIKKEVNSDTEDTEADTEASPNDLPLDCMLCMKTFNSMSGLKAHVIAQHSYKSVKRKTGDSPRKTQKTRYPCTICKRTFTTSTDLMVHETCHNKDVCYGCNAKFDSFELLADHRKRCKAISSAEQKRPKMLDDVIRPRSVESSSSQELVKSEDNTESLTCNLCSEVFSDNYYLKIHQEIHHSLDNSEQIERKTDPLVEAETLENVFSDST